MLFILNRDEQVSGIYSNNNSPKTCPYYDDVLKESLDTGTSSYEFKIPCNHPYAKYIEEGGYVVRRDLDGKTLMFTIMQIEETHGQEHEKFIFAENTGMEIINSIFRPAKYMSINAKNMLDELLIDTRWETGKVDNLGIRDFNFEGYDNKLLRLQQVANEFDAEIDFEVELNNGKITKRLVNLRRKRGKDTKKRFTYSKDITRITRKVDMSEVVTALIGVGKGDIEGKNFLDFSNVSWTIEKGYPANKPLNQDWIGDQEALQRYGKQGRHISGVYEYETDNANELIKRTWKRLQELKEPKITYELDVSLLEQLANIEHEKVRIGDVVYIIDETFQPSLMVEGRIRELETSFTDPTKNKATLGNFKPAISNITKEIRDIQERLLKKEATWEDVGEIIFKGEVPPTSPVENNLWLDTSVSPNTLYRYDGVGWEKASPTDAQDVGAYGFNEGEKLSVNLKEVEGKTTDNAIKGTIFDSEDFNSVINSKANTDDLEGLATSDEVGTAKKEVNDYVDERLDGEDGVNQDIAQVKSDLTKSNTNITAKFEATGGVNLVQNSIGFAETDLWLASGTINTVQSLELEQLGFGSGFVTSVGESGNLEQTINTVKSDTYTISFYMKKTKDSTTNGYAGIEIFVDGEKEVFLGKDTGTGITDGYEKYTHTFNTNFNETSIKIIFGNEAEAIITGIMINQGDEPLQWSLSMNEVYAKNIVMNLNGIKVISNSYNGYTLINEREFSGYAEVLNEENEPQMERVFTLNGDTTEVSKIDIDKEINMSPIKTVPISSENYNGWAFIPSK